MNAQYVSSIVKQLNAAQSHADIASIQSAATAQLNSMSAAATAQISSLASLQVVPTTLSGCISWITAAGGYYISQAAKCTQLVADCSSAVAQITSAVAAANARVNH